MLNRSVTQNPDGSWVLPNVPANLGPVRARVTCLVNGQTVSGESDPFLVPANGVVNLPPIRFGQTTPIPLSLSLSSPTTTLAGAGQTAQLTVTARYSDGSTKDVTASTTFTQYTVSNPQIATVSPDGLVTAIKSGLVLIQSSHEGTTGMISLRVIQGGGADTDGDGIPDADETALGLDPANPVDAQEDFDRDGLTNLREYQLGTDLRKADTDGDGLKDGAEIARGTDPFIIDTDGDGIADGLEVQTNSDPRNPASYNLAGALSSVAVTPPLFTLTFNTIASDVSVQLTVSGTLRDGRTIDLTSPTRGTNYTSSDLNICNFSTVPGRVFAGQSGTCSVTATVAGHSAASAGTVHTFSPIPVSSVALAGAGQGVDVAGTYVYVAVGMGLQVIDVSNRATPFVAATLPLPGSSVDVKLSGTRAYVAAGSAGLHIVDVSNAAAPVLMGTVDTPGSAADVRVRGNYAYVADGSNGLQIVDVTVPTSPQLIANAPTGNATGVDVTNTLAVVTRGGAGVQLVDITNPAVPVLRGSAPSSGSSNDVVVSADGNTAFVADYTGSLRAIDIRNPAAPVLAGATQGSLGGYLFDVARSDSFVFGADVFFVNGVPIVDGSDPYTLRPRSILNFPGDATGLGIAVDGSYVYLGTDAARLYIGQYRIQEDLNGIPPTAAISAPADGSTFVVGEPIVVTVNAADDLAVVGVALQVDGVQVATDTTAPFQFNITAPSQPGNVVLGATASDLGNNIGTAANVGITVIADPLTTITGRVVVVGGAPVAGASVTCNGSTTATAPDGSFTLNQVGTVPLRTGCLITGTGASGLVLSGVTPAVLVRGGVTALGDVVIAPVPLIASVTPRAIDATRPPASLTITGANLSGATFSLLPAAAGLSVGAAVVNPSGTSATFPVTVSSSARGQFVLVGTNSFGGATTASTGGNTLTVFNAQDDGDSDGDGYADGLELLFGADPTNPISVPDFSRVGFAQTSLSVTNTTLPSGVFQHAELAVSVLNTTIPETVPHSSVSSVSVLNRALPTGVVQSALSSFSVVNRTLPTGVTQSSVATFSVLNSSLPTGTTRFVASPAVSLLNVQPAPYTPPTGTTTGTGVLSISLTGLVAGTQLVEGQTLVVGASVANGAGTERVTFSVNGSPLAIVAGGPYAMAFTVPAGVSALAFDAHAVSSDGTKTADAARITTSVVPDIRTTITGRIVDSSGIPVPNAIVDLLSDGLRAEYFDAATALSALPNLNGVTPTQTSRITAINSRNPNGVFGFDPLGTGMAPDYAARFSGWLLVPSAGTYTFYLGADEGARLKVGGITVIDMPTPAAAGYQERAATVTLQPGPIALEIDYYESTGNAQVQLSVAAPGGTRQAVLPSSLVPPADPLLTTTDVNGQFSFSGVPTVLSNVRVRVTPTGVTPTVVPVSGVLSGPGVDLGDVVVNTTP